MNSQQSCQGLSLSNFINEETDTRKVRDLSWNLTSRNGKGWYFYLVYAYLFASLSPLHIGEISFGKGAKSSAYDISIERIPHSYAELQTKWTALLILYETSTSAGSVTFSVTPGMDLVPSDILVRREVTFIEAVLCPGP